MKFSFSRSLSLKCLQDPHCIFEFCGILGTYHRELYKERFKNMHDIFLCVYLHMYKYTHTDSLLSHFTLYTLLFLFSSKWTGSFFSQFTLYTCSFSVLIYIYAPILCSAGSLYTLFLSLFLRMHRHYVKPVHISARCVFSYFSLYLSKWHQIRVNNVPTSYMGFS